MQLQRIIRLVLSALILLTLLVDASGLYKYPFLKQLENWTYDTRLNFTRLDTIDERVVIVDIDENSLAEVGDSIVTETLIENPAAPMTRSVCHTLMDRFSSEVWVLDKLAHRDDLISEIAIKLTTIVSATAREKLECAFR